MGLVGWWAGGAMKLMGATPWYTGLGLDCGFISDGVPSGEDYCVLLWLDWWYTFLSMRKSSWVNCVRATQYSR